MNFPGRYIHGHHTLIIEEKLRRMHEEATALHPEIVPSDLLPASYRSQKETRHLESLGMDAMQLDRLRMVKYDHLADLQKTLKNRCMALPDTIIPWGRLSIPSLCAQGKSEQGCTNACFRMLYEGITGDHTYQLAAEAAVEKVHGHPLIHDEEYLKVFSTPTFRALYPELKVRTHTLLGVDLEMLKKVTTKIKTAHPDAWIFCMVNLQTATSLTDVWHANILIGSEEGQVIVHDPSGREGTAFKRLEKAKFYKRWAIAYNRAHLLVVSGVEE